MNISYSIVNSFSVADAGTGEPIGGNGAAVVFMEAKDQFSDATQLEMAKRFPELCEAVFVYPGDGANADIGMRYWSPQRLCEYKITGHPTIAAAFAMLLHDHPSISRDRSDYRLETKAGNVVLRVDHENKKVFMGQIQPEFQDVPLEMEQEVREILGLKTGDDVSPIKAVNMGLGYFIFRVKDLDTLMAMKRGLPRLIEANKRLGLNGGAHPYADTSDGSQYDLRTRNLDLRPLNADGVWLEDSACGQGSASVMAYLMKYCNHLGTPIRMEQGVPSEPCCVEASGEWRGEMPEIFIGGSAFERERGVLEISGPRIERRKIS